MSNSEGGRTRCRKPLSAQASQSDDEISVIAVIKKGTSGIPKRARYHYIRELPLASVKSMKKTLQKSKDTRRGQGQVTVTTTEPCSKTLSMKEATRPVTEPKKPRIIELSDENSKMELRKQFKMAEDDNEEDTEISGAGLDSYSASGGAEIIHKLPPGTVLIKQEPRTPSQEPQLDNPGLSNPPEANEPETNDNRSSAATTSTTTSSSSNTSGSSSASSCGSGSSSGGFGSGSASPSGKVKRLHRATKTAGGGRKTTVDVIPRRNPKRNGSKKVSTMAEVAIPLTTTMTTRPRRRQQLLSTRRQERIGSTLETGTNRKTKVTTMPYMNTRSVTRKLYTVGATYQAPTRKDETEWREWPAHGMHERPVFHPQIGLAAGYAGRIFWSTTDAEGSNWTYREVLEAPEEVEIVRVDPRPSRTPSTPSPTKTGPKPSEESFEVCMHDSLHSVLAYCAQVMAPGYHNMVERKGRQDDNDAQVQPTSEFSPQKDAEAKSPEVQPLDADSTHINLSQLEDSSISDETLMQMSSIYTKLLPIEDQPSSREDSPSDSAQASPHSANHFSGRETTEGCSSVAKNASEASEIARILSEYNDSLKETGLRRPFSSAVPGSSFAKKDQASEVQEAQEKTFVVNEGTSDLGDDFVKAIPGSDLNGDHWLEDLLVDTSLLYCVATGVGQHDLTKYVDSLDGKQSLQWLRNRDG